MRRTLFMVASGASAVLCAAIVMAWVVWGDDKDQIAGTLENPNVTGNYPLRLIALLVPYWAVVLLTAVLPLAFGVCRVLDYLETRRLDRAGRGRCPACGYDLCATPDRCPECGTVPATTKGAA